MASTMQRTIMRGIKNCQQYSIIVKNEKDFLEKIQKSKEPVIVDFGANWCRPCKELEPRLDNVMAKYKGKISVAKIDIDNMAEVAAKCEVGSIPALIVFRNGKMKERLVGLQDETKLTSWVDGVLEKTVEDECDEAKIKI